VTPPLSRRLLAEFLGSAFLAALVIGSGIAAQQLSDDVGLQLLENAAATAAGLFAIIPHVRPRLRRAFQPGRLARRRRLRRSVPACRARLHPRPGRRLRGRRGRRQRDVRAVGDQHLHHHRASPAHLFAEIIATLGLLLVIFALARTGRATTAPPAAVGAYIGAAYWFTSSTSFANPAISVGRMFSDTFAGIAPASVPAFVIAQLAGGVAAFGLLRVLYPDVGPATAAEVVLPHAEPAGQRS
jgi:glycerol uptake facilitator-like aquaporin